VCHLLLVAAKPRRVRIVWHLCHAAIAALDALRLRGFSRMRVTDFSNYCQIVGKQELVLAAVRCINMHVHVTWTP
jgi:hypothetical protein